MSSEPGPWSLSDLFRKRFSKTVHRSTSKYRVGDPNSHAQSTFNLLPDPPSTSTSTTSQLEALSDDAGTSNAPERAAWQTLTQALHALESSMDIFPPLKSAIGGLLSCVQHVKIAQWNQTGYKELANDLASLVNQLQMHLPDSRQARMPYSISNVARAIEEHTTYLKRKHEQYKVAGFVMAREDNEDMLERYRRIEGLFRRLQASPCYSLDISLSTWSLTHEQWTDIRLKDLVPAHHAYYNSALSTEIQRRGCTKNTREKILDDAQTWTWDPDAPNIYWMNGMAGTGKTTIAYSLCERLEMNKQLGGSFFCSRSSPDCRDVSRIVPTIAYQLARFSNPYQSALCETLGCEPDVARRKVDVQFQRLILEPLAKVKNALPEDLVVVIDALDECTDSNGMRLVLDLVFRHATKLPIKLFITSRPEPIISNRITPHDDSSRLILHLHDIEKSLVQADIHLYLSDALGSIRPAEKDIEQLATRAGCLFIFAATVVRYIAPETPSLNHSKRLAVMLQATSTTQQGNYKEIDDLYSTILANALEDPVLEDDEKEMRRLVLWTVICACEPLDAPSLTEIFNLENSQELEDTLQPLLSVLHVSGPNRVVSTLHASFPDFLFNDQRSGRFVCDKARHNEYLASQSFTILAKQLRFNICNIESSYQLDSDMPELANRVDSSISLGLLYASRYWGDHLTHARATTGVTNSLQEFLKYRFLFWMEVLNLKRWMGHAENTLTQVLVWLPEISELTELRQFIYDARNFITTYSTNAVSLSTPHIYISALPFTSKQSHIWLHYSSLMRGLPRVEGEAMAARGRSALASWLTGSGVCRMALAPDGRRIASGLYDSKVVIWDVSTGTHAIEPLVGHRGAVNSIAISSDGTRIASGSADCTIIIWQVDTGGKLAGPLRGHTRLISGLAFSPEGSYLVSGSEDHTIRMWDGHNGIWLNKLFKGHLDAVMSVSFSPDGKRIASGSDDRTIRVWDPETCATIAGPFVGHTDWIDCIAFSPDGKRIVSSSLDRTVRVWDSYSGEILAGPFEGHTDRVISVAFSPDGMRIASGSYDHTVWVWDSHDGRQLAGPFDGRCGNVNAVVFSTDGTRVYSGSEDGTICVWDARDSATSGKGASGHTGAIRCVTFSPNGTRAASGSTDSAICVWDTCTGALVAGPLMGHTSDVISVAFSPDGKRIVSGSTDCTLRTWDAFTGTMFTPPFKGHTDWVRSVAFSPDGRQIASGSGDTTIRLWNSRTGRPITDPFSGHAKGVISVAFSPDGGHIVSGSYDSMVRMWQATNGNPIWTSDTHTSHVRCVVFSRDGTRVVLGSRDCTVLVLDARDGAVLHGPVAGPANWAWPLALSIDGASAISISRDQNVHIWEAQTGRILAGSPQDYGGEVRSLAFSPDGRRVISGSANGIVLVWDVAPTLQPAAFSFHDWTIEDDGWLMDSESQRVLWVPPDLRSRILLPNAANHIVMGGSCTVRINSTSLLGDRWISCYDASQRPIPL